jgi:hypothetical protein
MSIMRGKIQRHPRKTTKMVSATPQDRQAGINHRLHMFTNGYVDMFAHSYVHRPADPISLDYLRMPTVAPKTVKC